MLGEWLEERDPAGVLVAEQRDCVVGVLIEVAEADDVPERLDRVEDPVGPRVRLDQSPGAPPHGAWDMLRRFTKRDSALRRQMR